ATVSQTTGSGGWTTSVTLEPNPTASQRSATVQIGNFFAAIDQLGSAEDSSLTNLLPVGSDPSRGVFVWGNNATDVRGEGKAGCDICPPSTPPIVLDPPVGGSGN